MKRNTHFTRLSPSYLFPEVQKRVKSYQEAHPQVSLINLSIGDTTQPLPESITHALKEYALLLGTEEGYQGYGPEQGDLELRTQIANHFYKNRIHPDEIFISDGAKCDLGRLTLLFDRNLSIAVQDPSYPVYVDTSLLMGREIHYLPCHPENHFFPSLDNIKCDLLYFCSPNNPTGSVATKEELEQMVACAQKNKFFILFDAAYAGFIQDPLLPRSIYEIEGAREVAIEISSFSKLIGFTGVRLGWSVVPTQLKYENGLSVQNDWRRIVTTFFNGASRIAQAGGIAALTPKGQEEIRHLLHYYRENASILKEAFEKRGDTVYGGVHVPYLWISMGDKTSWTLFQELLESTGIVATPGSGFGPRGEGFLRLSAFAQRDKILKAAERVL